MKIGVTPGDVVVASVNVKRHSGGIYTVQIQTPHNRKVGLGFTRIAERHQSVVQVSLYPEGPGFIPPTVVSFTAESMDEEEALFEGFFELEAYATRYSVALIAIPASVLEESEEAGMWEPQGNVDYLT